MKWGAMIMKKSKKQEKSKKKKDTSKNSGQPLNNENLNKSPGKTDKNEESEKGYFTIDMPDVKDIPGQEHIHVPHLRGLNDITISSDDEEGKGIWEEEEEL